MDRFANLTQGFGEAANDLRNRFNQYQSNQYVVGTQQFLESNSIVAKFVFLLLIVILFVVILRIGTSIMAYLFMPTRTPKIIDGMKQAHIPQIVPQAPSASGSKTIYRSVNQRDGIEFTYSVWMFIENLKNDGTYKHVFHKGNDGFSTSPSTNGLNQPNNAPGLYIDKDSNSLVIIMNTYDNINEKVMVRDIPLNKWVNVIMRVEGQKMDVYINGTIVLRHEFSAVPKQNYGDVYVNLNGGYDGYLADLFYYDYALTTMEILRLVEKQPNLTMNQSYMKAFPPYFSMRWFFSQ
jgi:hypothetical protein